MNHTAIVSRALSLKVYHNYSIPCLIQHCYFMQIQSSYRICIVQLTILTMAMLDADKRKEFLFLFISSLFFHFLFTDMTGSWQCSDEIGFLLVHPILELDIESPRGICWFLRWICFSSGRIFYLAVKSIDNLITVYVNQNSEIATYNYRFAKGLLARGPVSLQICFLFIGISLSLCLINAMTR